MLEEVDYAEMLEIPVSTVNVVRKKNKKKNDMKEKVIEKVNERLLEDPLPAESPEEEGRLAESVLVETLPPPEKSSLAKKVVIGEFVAACLLCVSIFLTNVFLTDSAINTFLASLFTNKSAAVDARSYSDFTLSGVVSEYSPLTLETSPTGVISFLGEGSVYPVCDGKVESLTESDGSYTVVISHSDSFESIVSGLSSAYCAVGDKVFANLPVGYSQGEKEVQVMLYENDSLLNCVLVDSQNCLSWKE